MKVKKAKLLTEAKKPINEDEDVEETGGKLDSPQDLEKPAEQKAANDIDAEYYVP